MTQLKFSTLYKSTKKAVRQSLISMWCGEAADDSQKAYSEQISEKIDDLFAPDYAMPLVQRMNSYKTIAPELKDNIQQYIGGLWTKEYDPYQHQYDCWKALNEKTDDGKLKSICVTTGTGSGKTECFMLPLIHDLKKAHDKGEKGVQAIFLYPLNALMEDQKKRLNELLGNTGLKFAVYNGNTPERKDANDEELQKRIDEEEQRYPNIIATRSEMRNTPPQIILTNPTMLEYMLLRDKDQKLFKEKNLKWIVIDETHTYCGAAAAELAMLMRRIILAFDTNVDRLRFATSSATIGNSDPNESDKEKIALSKSESIKKLKQYICDLSGQSLEQIEVITVEPADAEKQLDDADAEKQLDDADAEKCRKLLFKRDYIPLNELIIDGNSIEERLETLDHYCDLGLKAKVHFFNRVPTTGLRIKLSDYDHEKGCFKIYTETPLDDNKEDAEPYLELMRCAECGAYFAVGEEKEDGTFGASTYNDEDIFSDNDHERTRLIFSLSDKPLSDDDENNACTIVSIDGNTLKPVPYSKGWNVLKTTECKCPHCSKKLSTQNNSDNDEIENKKVNSFRLNSAFISRLLAPVILDCVKESENDAKSKPHKGQQFLSFVDSRQSAANATLAQNLEEEKLWVYSRIFHELIERKQNGDNSISWNDIFVLLRGDEDCNRLCLQFAKRSKGSTEIDKDGCVSKEFKEKYVRSIMFQHLCKRPLQAMSPENMGLFTSYYPSLETIEDCPDEIKVFNNLIPNDDDKIQLEDWRNYLKLILDHNVRSNWSVYWGNTEIQDQDYYRYQTYKCTTKPYQSFTVDGGSIFVKYLVKLTGKSFAEGKGLYKSELNAIIDAVRVVLCKIELLSTETGSNNLRLDLQKLNFKLYDTYHFCDVNRYGYSHRWRPFETLFKGFSPIIKKQELSRPINSTSIDWSNYPCLKGKGDNSLENVRKWAKVNRKELCDYGLWGDNGIFASRLDSIYAYPEIFIQAEHTAQIDKIVAKQSQYMFVDKEINILACSTTMEMGIDLGELEAVLLCSLPPSPANYKQRAGRSGRDRNMVRSFCMTLCNSDSIGLRTMRNPLERMINRVVEMPYVDLKSAHIIQRHVNAFLLRESGLMFDNQGNNNLDKMVIDFFTPFEFDEDRRRPGQLDYTTVIHGNTQKSPLDGLGDKHNTKYNKFLDYLTNGGFDHNNLKRLVNATCLEDHLLTAADNCKTDLKNCYKIIKDKVLDLASDYQKLGKKEQNHRLHKYSDILSTGLIKYFSTNRFTPNANMPVEIIEFDVNFNNVYGTWNNDTSSNPSYTLQQALSQYAPGNTVTLGNRSRIVRGLLYTGIFRQVNTFKKLYKNSTDSAITVDRRPDNPTISKVNNKEELELIQPYAFIPDINENDTREVAHNRYTKVNAMLINATDWDNETHGLMKVRTSEEAKNSKILYYNAGIGYGYRMCRNCGKTTMEFSKGTRPGRIDYANQIMNNQTDNRGRLYHNNIRIKNQRCGNTDKIHKNVILGDFIQTDFCEIKFKKNKTENSWICNNSLESKQLLTTIAIVLTRSLVETLGIDSREVSFTITPDGSIVIFDTNPGGAGYSIRLGATSVMNRVIDNAIKILESKKSKEDILDKFTYRYIDTINPKEALELLKNEKASAKEVPQNILADYHAAVCSSFTDMLEDTTSNPIIFVSNLWDKWDYKNEIAEDWHYRIFEFKKNHNVNVCMLGNFGLSDIPTSVYKDIRSIGDWASVGICENPMKPGYYPIAYIGKHLYFVINKDAANLDFSWASTNLYSVELDLDINPQLIDVDRLSNANNNLLKFEIDENDETTTTLDLPKLVESKCQNIINQFKNHLNTCDPNEIIEVLYQDEHLKSCVGMVATLNFISYYLHKFDPNNRHEFKLDISTEKYDYKYPIMRGPHITGDLTMEDRDEKLEEMVKDWLDRIVRPNCAGYCIDPLEKKSLPHWRVLTFKCGNKELSFYPNGGIINEWFININPQDNYDYGRRYETIRVIDEIPLIHWTPIMYDVEIKEC